MRFPNYKELTEEEKELIVKRFIVRDLEKRFKGHDFNYVGYSLSLTYIENRTGIDRRTVSKISRKFLKSEKKKYKPRKTVNGTKYLFDIKRDEFERWKEKILPQNLEKQAQ